MPRDDVQALMWLNLAADRGDAKAVETRNLVARQMTPAQVAEAQKLSREWKPTINRPQ
jgi:TPR repeat protein